MSAPLRLVHPAPAAPAHPLLALAEGHPVLLDSDDADLITLVNAGTQVLDPATDPDCVTPATMQLAWFVHHVGQVRATDGDRSGDLASHLRRYVLPFLIELSQTKPERARTLADLRFMEAEQLTQILAGAAPLPAATVAGDWLGRVALTAIWLTVLDAAAVCRGGATTVQDAIARGVLHVHRDQHGHRLIFAADLRMAGLLLEPDLLHGMTEGSARNVLFPLKHAMRRAQNLGAGVRGDFSALQPVRPLVVHRMHDPRTDAGYLGLEPLRHVAAHLHVVHQTTLWLLRLMGLRIGEAFGLLVGDLYQDDNGLWVLAIEKQGGRSAIVRDPNDGVLKKQQHKPRTKTPQSCRIIRVPDLLVRHLLEIITMFHTDPDGTVRADARLIPGLRRDDSGGMAAFSAALSKAITQAGSPSFIPHDLRGHLITDLSNAGVDERVAEYYTGHRNDIAGKKTVHQQYDDGVPPRLQQPAVDAVSGLLNAAGVHDLIVPTTAVETWGTGTRAARRRDTIESQIRARGWRADPAVTRPYAVLLDTDEVAHRLGKSSTEIRRQFQTGELPARKVIVAGRAQWRLDERDLPEPTSDCLTLTELADRIGMTYHQARVLCLGLGVLRRDHTANRTAVRLDPAGVERVHVEICRRRDAAARALDLAAAAHALKLPVGQVETLYRSGTLQPAPDPTGGRRRHVTKASVDDLARTRAASSNKALDTAYVPLAVACAAMHLTRLELSTAVRAGTFRAVAISRRQHISLADALDYADRHALPAADTRRLRDEAVHGM